MSNHAKTATFAPVQLDIRHQIPGRIRLHVPGLRDDPPLSARLTQALQQLEGVRRVRWNPACASLTVWHRRIGPLTLDELSQALQPALQHTNWLAITPITAPRPIATTRPALWQRTQVWQARWRAVWPLRRSVRTDIRSVKPTCRLCQLKLTVARWVFADVWRCWTNELMTPPRSPLR